MKLPLVLLILFVSTPFAAVTDSHFEGENPDVSRAVDHGLKYLIIDNLCVTSGQITNAYSASTIGGAYDRWIAFDIIHTDEIYMLAWEGFSSHWIYYSGLSDLGDTYFEIYQDDLNSSPMYSFVVDTGYTTETDSGLDAFGRDVYLTEYDFLGQGNEMFLEDGTYWVAIQMFTDDNAFHCVREDSILDDLCWWYGDDGVWLNSEDAFGETSEGSYAIDGWLYT